MWMDVFLDPERPRQTSTALYSQVREAIVGGRLSPGDRLPTSRWLADDLGVARSTVTTVFGRLVAEGMLVARVGDGTYVADHPVAGSRSASTDHVDLVRRRPVQAPRPRTIGTIDIDLRTGRPDPRLFPLVAWRRAVRDAVEVAPPGYGNAAGFPPLRTAIAAWVGRSHADSRRRRTRSSSRAERSRHSTCVRRSCSRRTTSSPSRNPVSSRRVAPSSPTAFASRRYTSTATVSGSPTSTPRHAASTCRRRTSPRPVSR